MKWSKEKCKEVALLCESRNDFKIKFGSAYTKCVVNKWLDDVCIHLNKKENKQKGYWTYEKCKEVTLNYDKINNFRTENRGSYKTIMKNKWLELFDHMKKTNNWTYEKCKEVALLCKSRKEFNIKFPGAVKRSKNDGYYEEICSHMLEIIKPKFYWTKDKCQEIALKYTNKYDFEKNDCAAFAAMYKNKWLDICNHMSLSENIKSRCIYAYEFDDNYVYIGLTCNFKDRQRRHKVNGSVFEHIKDTNSNYNIIQLTEYIEQSESQLMENEYVEKYKNNGWCILNKCKTGSIGSSIVYWTKEKCLEESMKYKTRTEFQKNNKGAYLSSYRNKWLDEICNHMIGGKRKNGFWDYENCKKYANLCKNKYEFVSKYSGGYYITKMNGWLDDFFIKKE
jgi:hypothetical protein